MINPARISDPEILAAFVTLSRTIAENALSGQPVVVHLCDAEFQSITSERVALTLRATAGPDVSAW